MAALCSEEEGYSSWQLAVTVIKSITAKNVSPLTKPTKQEGRFGSFASSFSFARGPIGSVVRQGGKERQEENPVEASTTEGKVSAHPSRKRKEDVCSYLPSPSTRHRCGYASHASSNDLVFAFFGMPSPPASPLSLARHVPESSKVVARGLTLDVLLALRLKVHRRAAVLLSSFAPRLRRADLPSSPDGGSSPLCFERESQGEREPSRSGVIRRAQSKTPRLGGDK